jgi:hypothetical protein
MEGQGVFYFLGKPVPSAVEGANINRVCFPAQTKQEELPLKLYHLKFQNRYK